MASLWQKKLVLFILSYTGVIEDKALDVGNLDMKWGRQNTIELRNVAMNIPRLSTIAQLPPALRVETASILLLRITLPVQLYSKSIVLEIEGVRLGCKLHETIPQKPSSFSRGSPTPTSTRTPSHRKTARRIRLNAPYDSGGIDQDATDQQFPDAAELAESFFKEESIQEREEIQADIMEKAKGLEESTLSQSSEGSDAAAGTGVGLPGIFAGFVQGCINRLHVKISDVQAKLEADLPSDENLALPVVLCFKLEKASLEPQSEEDAGLPNHRKRELVIHGFSLDLLSPASVFADLSEVSSTPSPVLERSTTRTTQSDALSDMQGQLEEGNPSTRPSTSSTNESFDSVASRGTDAARAHSLDPMASSALTADEDRFADAGEEDLSQSRFGDHFVDSDDIRTGEDNISWGSRRAFADPSREASWSSDLEEGQLPESMLLDHERLNRSPRDQLQQSGTVHRAKPPLPRRLQSPGSWPQLDEGPHQPRPQQSPGSWPTLDQSQSGLYQSLQSSVLENFNSDDRKSLPTSRVHTLGPGMPHEVQPFEPSRPVNASQKDITDTIDNKQTALEHTNEMTESRSSSLSDQGVIAENMTESRMFSHEEAESMYMSAMSKSGNLSRESNGAASVHGFMPGGWDSATPSAGQQFTYEGKRKSHDGEIAALSTLHDGSDDEATAPDLTSSTSTARAHSPELPRPQTPSSSGLSLTSKQLVYVDKISVWLPQHIENAARDPDPLVFPQSPAGRQPNASYGASDLPGAFSAYSDRSQSRHVPMAPEVSERTGHGLSGDTTIPDKQPLTISIGTLSAQADLSSTRLLFRLVEVAHRALRKEPQQQPNPGRDSGGRSSKEHIAFDTGEIRLAFCDVIGSSALHFDDGRRLLTLLFNGIRGVYTDHQSSLQCQKATALVGEYALLSFSRQSDLQASTLVNRDLPDFSLRIDYTLASNTGREIVDVLLETAALCINVDLPSIESTLGCFGGISGALELGNSALGESGTFNTGRPSNPQKGVRFGDESRINEGTELKLSTRIAGSSISIKGSSCSVGLQSSTIRVVSRESAGVRANVQQVKLSGPHAYSGTVLPIEAALSAVEVMYLFAPQDNDLERLLTLITPSKDRYDDDDDILIDTLLRQRRKGGLIKLSIDDAKINISNQDAIPVLISFSQELSKLSAVAKYLPEDDRPGLLSLVKIRAAQASFPVSERFGRLLVSLADLDCAHVGLPALFAISIGSSTATRENGMKILHDFVRSVGPDRAPALMARMLGDEAEPTLKIKLYNLSLEYSVALLLDVTDLGKPAETEEIISGLANSVAELLVLNPVENQKSDLSRSASSMMRDKRTHVHLLVHDSAVGLSPEKGLAKAQLVVTDARFSVKLPPKDDLSAQLDLHKAALYLADEVHTNPHLTTVSTRTSAVNTAVSKRTSMSLIQQGYVSIATIMAARLVVIISQSKGADETSMQVEMQNELLLLETCADSTHTLFAVLGSLAPPSTPSQQPKYLTEPISIQDMVQSFSGDAYAKPEPPAEKLFDFDDDHDLISPEEISHDIFEEETAKLLEESEMTGSLYGPVNAIMSRTAEDGDDQDNFDETVESLLEEDPFEIPTGFPERPMSDSALLRDLAGQMKPPLRNQAIDLGEYESQDLGLNALPGINSVLDSDHRSSTDNLPFKLKLRDFHVIWNLYDGYDWKRTRDGITEAVEKVESLMEERNAQRRISRDNPEDEESVIGDLLFNSIYIGVSANQDAQELRRRINRGIDDLASETESVTPSGISRPTSFSASGRSRPKQRKRLRLERSRTHKIAFELKGVSADVLVPSPESQDLQSLINIRVRDVEVFDNVPTSTWRKFMTYHHKDNEGREVSKPMVHINIENVKTIKDYAATEMVIRVELLPLRLHVDQDALDFITRFFEFKDSRATPTGPSTDPPFIQRLDIDTVDLCLDYKPKTVDYGGIRSGHTTEFMNFIILDAANIRLKRIIVYGVKGFEPLHDILNGIWMPDVKRHQLPKILSGLAPVRNLVNLGSGVRDIVAIPVREYKKDGRVVRSVQKGAFQFGKTTASELARLGAKVAIGTQNLLQGAEGLLSADATSSTGQADVNRRRSADWYEIDTEVEEHEPRAISAYANQPLNVLAGLRSARRHLERDLLTAKDAFIAVQGEVLESNSPSGAAAAVSRHAPTVILRPVIGVSKAVSTTLLGVGNQFDRSNIRRIEDKYKHR